MGGILYHRARAEGRERRGGTAADVGFLAASMTKMKLYQDAAPDESFAVSLLPLARAAGRPCQTSRIRACDFLLVWKKSTVHVLYPNSASLRSNRPNRRRLKARAASSSRSTDRLPFQAPFTSFRFIAAFFWFSRESHTANLRNSHARAATSTKNKSRTRICTFRASWQRNASAPRAPDYGNERGP